MGILQVGLDGRHHWREYYSALSLDTSPLPRLKPETGAGSGANDEWQAARPPGLSSDFIPTHAAGLRLELRLPGGQRQEAIRAGGWQGGSHETIAVGPGCGELFQQGRSFAEPGGTHRPGPEARVSGPLHAGLPGGHSFAARTGGPHEPPDPGGRPQGFHDHRRLRRAPQRRAGSRRPAQHHTLPGPGGGLRGRLDTDLHEEGGGHSLGRKGPRTRPPSEASAWPTSPTAPACSRRWRAPSRCWRRWTGPTSGSSTNPPTG